MINESKETGLRLLEKGKRGIFQMIFSRSGLILVLLAIQVLFLFSIFHWFEAFLPHIYGGVVIFTVFMVLYLLVCLWGIVDSFLHSTPYYMGLSLLSPLFLLIPPLFWKITLLKPANLVSLTVNLFSFLALVIVIAFRG